MDARYNARTLRGVLTRVGCTPQTRPACPYHEDHASGLVGAVRDTNVLSQWRTVFQAARHIPLESGDARAGWAPRARIGPTRPWEAPG